MSVNCDSQRESKAMRKARQLLCLCVITAVLGCDADEEVPVQRVAVSGQVTLDGKPLRDAAIVFHQEDSSAESQNVTAHGFVENGIYKIDAEHGPAVGSARVEFRPKPLSREELEAAMDASMVNRRRRSLPSTVVAIPEKYGGESQLRVQLSADSENRHDFKLDSRR